MKKAPRWFAAVAVAALLWNLLGCFALATELRIGPADVAQMDPARQATYHARPSWALVATAIAVFAGALGCVGLLLRRHWAFPVLLVSLCGVIAQDLGMLVLLNGTASAQPAALALQSLVLLVAVGLAWLGQVASARRWLD